jgi:hypothetical protein
MNTNTLDRRHGCMGGNHQTARSSGWRRVPVRQCRWIPIRHEDVTSIVRVRSTAARADADRAAHHLMLAVGKNREGQAA